MNSENMDNEIQKKIDQAKNDMMEKGRSYDGLGEAIEKEGHEGPYFGPRNDIEYRKLIKDIKE